MLKIEKFKPDEYQKKNLELKKYETILNKKLQYAFNGRSALYHILKSLEISKGIILLPVYICESVLSVIKKFQFEIKFYDLDSNDLNADIIFIKKMCNLYDVKIILVASMYGNPANLKEIEAYCREKKIYLIDDAAQAFGARIENQYVGTFGDAGFFSFSPGKPLAGHIGALFWTKNKKYKIKYKNHKILHYLLYLDFYFNRLKIYENKKKYKIFEFVKRIIFKFFFLQNDIVSEHDKKIMGGILENNFTRAIFYRNYILKRLQKLELKKIKILNKIRGESNPVKIVLLFETLDKKKKFINFMLENKIYFSNGYDLLTKEEELKNALGIYNYLLEIPIEDNFTKMLYFESKLYKFDKRM
ncbi:DegT/DnrJ/EryC1/StrS family aminotransferase [Fusobacterium varium]|uniref:DegT/DnrJ/EryC1/StrS family aminotransferase n=1 Tax=Fusobacterium varium TaxID=856 RepID=UPI001F2DED96|nr:DegT/DnrJ/EryC1/StrS family aminotransferase [Fusobacterium varium]MCF2674700.1 DegT/DnrJ/EryC1/StrS family aminotransferase [Fusobacterium varium]